jgi:hypothetical protein
LGVQTPWHEALPDAPTHAWFVQVAAAPHVPVAVHVWTAAFPEHRVWPGAHTPLQEAVPAVTRQVMFEQAAGVPQAPDAEHVATALSEPPSEPVAHSVVPGEQTPVHAAEWVSMVTHAWLVQAPGGPQLPDVSHT